MTTQNPNEWTDSQHKIVKRWTIAAISLYGVILLGTVAVIAASNGPRDSSDESLAAYDSEEVAVPAFQPGRMSQLLTSPPQSTDGYNNTANPAPRADAARPAIVPVPEVDELVDNFHSPTGDSGFGPMPQSGAAPSTDESRLTARTTR